MSQHHGRIRREESGSDVLLIIGLLLVIGLVALPAALVALASPALMKRRPTLMLVAAVAGAALFWLVLRPPFGEAWERTQATMRAERGGLSAKLGILADAAPTFWLYTLPLAPGAGYVWAFFRPRRIEEQQAEREVHAQAREGRQITQAQRRAAAAITAAHEAEGPDAALLGVAIQGDDLFFTREAKRLLYLNTQVGVSSLHMLFLGENGAGKSETMFRVMASIAAATDWDVFYIDPKNETALRTRFYNLMAAHGRRCRLFPEEDVDGWRGDSGALLSRIMTIPSYADDGAAAYYQDVAEVYLRTVLDAWPTPPSSFDELEARLDYPTLTAQVHDHPLLRARIEGISEAMAASVVLRFRAMTPKLHAIRSTGWALEDARAAYFGLPVLANTRDSQAIAKYVIEDIKHYLAARSSPTRRKVFFIDEFGSIGTDTVIALMEMARSLGGIIGLATQTIAGLGDREQQQRIVGNCSVLLHRMSDGSELTKLAGVREAAQLTRQVDHQRDTHRATMRVEEVAKVSDQSVRTLPTGVCWIIARGRAAQVAMAQAPEVPDAPLMLDMPAARLHVTTHPPRRTPVPETHEQAGVEEEPTHDDAHDDYH